MDQRQAMISRNFYDQPRNNGSLASAVNPNYQHPPPLPQAQPPQPQQPQQQQQQQQQQRVTLQNSRGQVYSPQDAAEAQTRMEESRQRSITIVFWYKAGHEPIRLHEEIKTFPLFSLAQISQLVKDLCLVPNVYIDAYNPQAGTWEQQTITTVRQVHCEQRLLFRMRKSLLEGLKDLECAGLENEIRMQPHGLGPTSGLGMQNGNGLQQVLASPQRSLKRQMPDSATVDDGLGIIYLIESAQQFWSELEDVLKLPSNEYQTLALLDAALRRFLTLCAAYHEQYLQSPLQLEHAFQTLLESELFEFHSERMCEIIVDDAQSNTNPHSQFISYSILFWYGKRKTDFFKSHKRWQPLLPLLMDHVLVDIDPDVEDTYTGNVGTSYGMPSIPVPIEAKLRTLAVKLLYEVCRTQKFSLPDLRVFSDMFIDQLFDLVEHTRNMQDDTFNYSVIKLIVALNEQFMVASLPSNSHHHTDIPSAETRNRVIRVLMRRLGFSKTFGENMIFMLNRAGGTPEDLCTQLLILKILYLIFTTNGTSEYFYTNDLCVLVDVFLRELADLDEDSESLRNNYLRVLHPLLTRTQMRDHPYKRPQILYTLESLMGNSKIREISPTTKRLVERCLSGDWCVQLRARRDEGSGDWDNRSEISTHVASPKSASNMPTCSFKVKPLKASKSVENLKVRRNEAKPPLPSSLERLRTSNSSSASLMAMADSAPNIPSNKSNRKAISGSMVVEGTHAQKHHERPGSYDSEYEFHSHNHQLLAPSSPLQSQKNTRSHSRPPPPPPVHAYLPTPSASPTSSTTSLTTDQTLPRTHRRPAPAPPKRRKPPAIPAGRTNAGATITVIRSSEVAGAR